MRTALIAVVALAVAAPAAGGGYATAGVTPLPSGESLVWEPTVTIRAHGVTPVDGLEPVITIQNLDTGEVRRFQAEPVGSGGEYRFRVEFPGPGTWAYTVMDGYAGQVHTFAPVTVGAAAGSAPRADGRELLPWALGGAAALAALALLAATARRGRAHRAAATRAA